MTILFIVGIVVASAAIIGGSLYYKQNFQQQKLSTSNLPSVVVDNREKNVTQTSPQKVVDQFLQAVQNKNRSTAKQLLSPNANQETFKSTTDESFDAPSLYTIKFTYKILNSSYDSTNTKAYVDVEIIVNDQNLMTKFFLEKTNANSWLIFNSETTSQSTSIPFNQASRSANLSRVLLVVDGPAEFLLISPEKKRTGFDPTSKTYANEISDATYAPKAIFKTFTITDLIGTWELQVIGQNRGKYSITTELVDNTNHQTSKIEGNIVIGEIKTYLLKYPNEKGKPLEVALLN